MACFKGRVIFSGRRKRYFGFTFVETLSSLTIILVLCSFLGVALLSELNRSRLDETVKYARVISNASESHRTSVSQVSYKIPSNDELKSIYRGGFIFSSQYRNFFSEVLDWNNPQVFSLSYLYDTSFPSKSFLDDQSVLHLRQSSFFSVVYFDVASHAEGLDRYAQSLKDSVHGPQNKMLIVPSQYTRSPYLLDLSAQYLYKTHSHWQEFRL